MENNFERITIKLILGTLLIFVLTYAFLVKYFSVTEMWITSFIVTSIIVYLEERKK